MRVFIGNIPCGTNSAELRFILYKCLTRSIWRQFKLAVVYRFDVRRDVRLKIKKQADQADCYAVAEFSQPVIGKLSIGLLRKYVLRGKRLAAHEFMDRAYANERRAVGSGDKLHRGGERRRSERRSSRQLKGLPARRLAAR